jgi:replicative DNA helicase
MSGTKCGLDDFFASGRTRSELDAHISDELPGAVYQWESRLPLDDMTGPDFPVDALPGTIAAYCLAVAEETQTDPAMPATVALGTISAAAGGKYDVVIPEHGWSEPVVIMALTGAEPATRKTRIFRLETKPLVDYERLVNPDERRAVAEHESRERVLEKQLQAAENAGSKIDDGKIRDTEAVRMAAVEELHEHRSKRPRISQIIADDATPEAAKSLLAEQGGHIAVMSAESAFLSNTAGGRYSDSPNLDVLLNGHAGDRIRVNRQGRASETIESARVTLCLMVQPDVIRELGKSPGFIARGGAARLLPSFPPDMLGRRRIDVQRVPYELAEAWHAIITAVVQRRPITEDDVVIPWPLYLDASGMATFREYRVQHEADMNPNGAYAEIRDWAGKQPGAVLRIAGLLHITTNATPEAERITGETIQRAIRVVDYFAEHARIMYALMRGVGSHADARLVLDVIRELGTPTSRREVHRRLRGRVAFNSPRSLEAPLAVLEDHGYIRRHKYTGERGGRPSERIELSPLENMAKTPTTHSDEPEDLGYGRFDYVSDEPTATEDVVTAGVWSMDI